MSTAPRALKGPVSRPATPNLIDITQSWAVAGDAATVFAWLQSHPPDGLIVTSTGSSGGPNRAVIHSVTFGSGRPTGSDAGQLQVAVTDVGSSTVELRVDAIVTYGSMRSARQRVPVDVRRLDIVHRSRNATAEQKTPITITDRAEVRRVISLVNELDPAPTGRFPCRIGSSERYHLAFVDAEDGSIDAEATVSVGGCAGVDLLVAGLPEIRLEGSEELVELLARLDP